MMRAASVAGVANARRKKPSRPAGPKISLDRLSGFAPPARRKKDWPMPQPCDMPAKDATGRRATGCDLVPERG